MCNCTVCCKLHRSISTIELLLTHEVTRNCISSPLSSPVRRIIDSAPSVHDTTPQRTSCGASTWESEAVVVTINHDAASTPPRLPPSFAVCSTRPLALTFGNRCPTAERTVLKPLAVTAVSGSKHDSIPLPQRLGPPSQLSSARLGSARHLPLPDPFSSLDKCVFYFGH
jgi:hypothetical protein